jgi:hypothetical protein
MPRLGAGGQAATYDDSSAPTYTAPTNWNSLLVPILDGAARYRIVSAGFRIRRISPPLTTSGMVFVRSHNVLSTSEVATLDGNTYLASQTADIALADCHDACFLFEHTSQLPETFYNVSNPLTFISATTGFCPITVSVEGGVANTPVLQVEFIMHVEYGFTAVSALNLAATPAPPSNQLITGVSNIITSEASNFLYDGAAMVAEKVRKSATTYLAKALWGSPNPAAKAAGGVLMLVD